MSKTLVLVRVDKELLEQVQEVFARKDCPYTSKSDILRDCLYEGIMVIRQKIADQGVIA